MKSQELSQKVLNQTLLHGRELYEFARTQEDGKEIEAGRAQFITDDLTSIDISYGPSGLERTTERRLRLGNSVLGLLRRPPTLGTELRASLTPIGAVRAVEDTKNLILTHQLTGYNRLRPFEASILHGTQEEVCTNPAEISALSEQLRSLTLDQFVSFQEDELSAVRLALLRQHIFASTETLFRAHQLEVSRYQPDPVSASFTLAESGKLAVITYDPHHESEHEATVPLVSLDILPADPTQIFPRLRFSASSHPIARLENTKLRTDLLQVTAQTDTAVQLTMNRPDDVHFFTNLFEYFSTHADVATLERGGHSLLRDHPSLHLPPALSIEGYMKERLG